jgi:tetratricopeptide (TPR) repeat protein
VLSVAGLPVPAAEDFDCADAFDAVKLFVLRARAVQPQFELHAHREAVCGIVTRLGGHPLAIQLAAGWSRLLPATEIARAVDDSLDVLESAPSATATRPEHSSMRATLDQSWSLLAPSERNLLAALSVFAGSFDRTAARHVAGAALPLLASLCDKSLIETDSAGRFALHPVVRTYEADKLAAGPETQAAEYRRLHAEHYCGRLAKVTDFDALDQSAALRRIELDLANISAAWDQAILLQRSDLLADAATAVERFYDLRGPQRQGIDMLARAQRALSCRQVSDHRAMWRVALGHANLLWAQGHFGEVVAPAQAALSSARQLDDQYAIKSCLNTLGLAAWNLGQLGDARRYIAEALERARGDGSPFEIAVYTGNLLLIERSLGALDTAHRLAQEALAGYRQCKHREGEAAALGHIAQLLLDQDRPAEALAPLHEALALIHDAGFTAMQSTPLMRLAQAHFALGELSAARVAATRALENARTLGERRVVPLCLGVMSRIELAAGDSAAALECLREAARICRPMNSARTTHEVLIRFADAHLQLGQLSIAGQILATLKLCGDIAVPEAAEVRRLEQRLEAAGGCTTAETSGLSIDQALRIIESPRKF